MPFYLYLRLQWCHTYSCLTVHTSLSTGIGGQGAIYKEELLPLLRSYFSTITTIIVRYSLSLLLRTGLNFLADYCCHHTQQSTLASLHTIVRFPSESWDLFSCRTMLIAAEPCPSSRVPPMCSLHLAQFPCVLPAAASLSSCPLARPLVVSSSPVLSSTYDSHSSCVLVAFADFVR